MLINVRVYSLMDPTLSYADVVCGRPFDRQCEDEQSCLWLCQCQREDEGEAIEIVISFYQGKSTSFRSSQLSSTTKVFML